MRDTSLNFKNILIIDFGQLGDVVLSLPALGAVRRRFPDSRIAVLSGKVPGEVLRLSAVADEVITVDRVDLRDGPKLRSLGKVLRMVRELRARPFDLVIDLHSLSETNILAFLTRAKKRLLSNRESRSLDRLSNFDPPPPAEDKSKHLTDRYFDVLSPLGIDEADRMFHLNARGEDQAFVDERYFSEPSVRTVGLFPGAGHPSRCWPLEKFAELAAGIDTHGLRPYIFLGPEESGMRDRITAIFPPSAVIVDGLTISQLIAAASRLEAFVTNDTGPMHLAACAGAPVVLLLDERGPTTYLPLTGRLEIVRNRTIAEIAAADAQTALMSLIGRQK